MDTKIVENEAASMNETRRCVCRLCMSKESLKNIFQQDGLNIWISKFLSIVVSREDNISLMVCDDCRTRLFDFREFQLRCLKVQNELEIECADMETISSKRSRCIGAKKKLRQDSELAYNCSKCGKIFQSQRRFELHNEIYHFSSVFQCGLCSQFFPAVHLLRKHTKIHSERERKHFCAICGFAFLETIQLRRHMELHRRKKLKIKHRFQTRQKVNEPVNDCEKNHDQGQEPISESSNNLYVEPGADELFEATSIKIEPEIEDSKEEHEKMHKREKLNIEHKIQARQNVNEPVNDRELHPDQSQESIPESSYNDYVEPGADDLFEATSIKIEPEREDSNEEQEKMHKREKLNIEQRIQTRQKVNEPVNDLELRFDQSRESISESSDNVYVVVYAEPGADDLSEATNIKIESEMGDSKATSIKIEPEMENSNEEQEKMHKREKLNIEQRIQATQNVNEPVNDRELYPDHRQESILESSDNVYVEPGADDLFEATSIKIEPEMVDSNEEHAKIIDRVSEVCREAGTSANSEASKFECDISHKYFKTQNVLSIHKRSVHSPKMIDCPTCTLSFASRIRLRRHERMVHNKEKTIKCEVCGFEFFRRYDMKRHMKVHQEGYVRRYGRS